MDNNLTDALRMYLVVFSMIISTFVLTIAYFYFVRLHQALVVNTKQWLTIIPRSLQSLLSR